MAQKRKLKKHEEGFSLFYVLVVMGVLLIATSIFLESALEEIILSADREDSDLALYAAESGVECMLYHHYTQEEGRAFYMKTEPRDYSCGGGSGTFTAGWGTSSNDSTYESGQESESDNCYLEDEDGETGTAPVFGIGIDPSNYGSDIDMANHESDPSLIENIESDACASVTVEVRPRLRVRSFFDEDIGEEVEETQVHCAISIRSVGASECDADGNPTPEAVERTRVENI